MPQSLARLDIHLVFSTKNREQWLSNSIRDELHAYMATVLQNMGCKPVILNSVEDHIHLLFEISRTRSISQVVEEIKKASSKWIKTLGPGFASFSWQSGYGAFAVSVSNVPTVRDYIANQREHHRNRSFQEEYRRFLELNQIAFDERFVWD